MKDIHGIKKIAYLGMLAALAIIFGYIESLIPVFVTIPGVKLGIANLVSVYALMFWGWREASSLVAVRIIVLGFLFGNLFSIVYSISGAALSLAVMCLCKKFDLHIVVSSICGGTLHNIGQLLAASAVLQSTAVFYYAPALVLSGITAGAVMGILSNEVIKRL